MEALKDIYHCRTRNTIMVSGGRGVGKTFFVLNIKQYIDNSNDDISNDKVLEKLNFIKTIDPTLLHESENFLTIIIAKILNVIESLGCDQKMGEEDKKQFYKKLSAVADSIDGICGIDRCKRSAFEIISQDQSSLKLEQNLHDFFGIVYRLMGEKQLVLVIDDIDMAFDKGYEVLEVVRKYLNSPYIIPIITGDITLYEMIIQKELSDKLSFDKLELDPFINDDLKLLKQDKKSRIKEQGDDYLGKLFEHKSRIYLKKLADFDEEKQEVIHLESKKEFVSLQRFYEILENAPAIPLSTLDQIKSFKLRIFLSFAKDIFTEIYLLKEPENSTDILWGSLADKIVHISQIYGFNYNLADRYFYEGNAYREKSENDCAIEAYKKAVDINPKNENVYFALGTIYTNTEEYDEAIQSYHKVIELNPKNDHAFYNMGNAYIKIKDYGLAIEAYTKATEINPKFYAAYSGIANSYLSNEDYDKAIDAYLKAIEISPKNARNYINLGYSYSQNGHTDKAIESYLNAIKLDSTKDIAFNNLGVAYKETNEFDKAELAYKNAIDLNQMFDLPYLNLFEVQVLKDEKLSPDIVEEFKKNFSNSSWFLVFEMFEILANKLDDDNLDDLLESWDNNYGNYPRDWNFEDLDIWANTHSKKDKIQKCLDIFKSHKQR